jgi:hypothetical protein
VGDGSTEMKAHLEDMVTPDEVIMPGAFKHQENVPFRNGTAGEILGKATLNEDGSIDMVLNDRGMELFYGYTNTTGKEKAMPELQERSERVFIVPGNLAQAYDFCRERGINPLSKTTRIILIGDTLKAMGARYIEGDQIHYVGNCYMRNDIQRIQDIFLQSGFPREMAIR